MPLWTPDFHDDTHDLTDAEGWAYTLLLTALWKRGGSLPNDPKVLARYTHRTPTRWKKISGRVLDLFELSDGMITHPMVTQGLARARAKSDQARDAANARYRKKAEKNSSPVKRETLTVKRSAPVPGRPDANAPELNFTGGATEADPISQAVIAWNDWANARNREAGRTKFGRVQLPELNDNRRHRLWRRLQECGGPDEWAKIINGMGSKPWLMGTHPNQDGTWWVSFDWLCESRDNLRKVMEGLYRDGNAGEDANTMQAAIARRKRAIMEGK